MSIRIELGWRRGVRDPRGDAVVSRARRFLRLELRGCRTRDVFQVDADLPARACHQIRRAFTDPVLAVSALDRLPPPASFDWLVEVGFRPGVTDNVGRTARVVVEDLLGRPLGERREVYTSVQYFLRGALDRAAVERLATELLANTLIQTVAIHSADEWRARPVDRTVPALREPAAAQVRVFDLGGTDADLMRISREGVLSLSLDEMRAIRDHFAQPALRERRAALGLPAWPTDVELECIAQTWSEHCKHKIFAARIRYADGAGGERVIDGLFKTYIKAATAAVAQRVDWLVSVFSDNAGVVRFDERYNVLFKVETHNSPSALDPYGGAMTGIVGVNRDAIGTGMGGEMLCNTWGYCLGAPEYAGDLPPGLMHPRRIRDGVHQGVIEGGNQSGIPWMRGFERFDDRFIGKPLVFCGTVGRLPREVGGRPSERKEIEPGDAVVMVGGRIGKDGIHGATFSSEELHAGSPAQAVQIGDPITQRRLYEFLIEARDLGLFRALTDNGAGGLSSSVGEMARLCGGAVLELDRAPLKYEGLQPWEIFLSEAQERMSLAVPPASLPAFLDLARRRDVEAVAIGSFTREPALELRHAGRLVGRLDMDFLHDGCPRLELEARWVPPQVAPPPARRVGPRSQDLLDVLAALNVCSKEEKSRIYDGEVKGLSVVKAFVGVRCDVPADATVMRVAHDSAAGLALSEGINPFYSDLDAGAMAASVLDEAVRRIVSAGGEWGTIAALDNFCWPDPVQSEKTPDGAYKLAQLVRCNEALHDLCLAYGVPLISGKDSMKNDSTRGGRKISIPPTLLVSALGRIAEAGRALTMPFQQPGDLVYVAGWTREELGASEYHRCLAAAAGRPADIGGNVPTVRAEEAAALYRAHNAAAARGLLRSSHTPTAGGLAVGFALCAIGGDCGVEADLAALPTCGACSRDALLFSESNSRFILTCDAAQAGELEAVFSGLPLARVGQVTDSRAVELRAGGRHVVRVGVDAARRAFRGTLHGL